MAKCFTPFIKRALVLSRLALVAILISGFTFHAYGTAWTTSVAGTINTLSNWTDGTTAPTTFTTPGDTWTVTMAMTLPATATWTLGTAAAAPDTLFFETGGTLTSSGAGSTFVINVHGSLEMDGGTFSLGGAGTTQTANIDGSMLVYGGTVNSTGSSTAFHINTNGLDTVSAGTISSIGAGSSVILINNGDFSISGGNINGSSTITITINGNSTISGGTVGAGGNLTFTTNGNTNVTGGTIISNGAGGFVTMNTHGNFVMTGGTFSSSGAGCTVTNNVFGNCSYSGPCNMTNTGAGCHSYVHLSLPTGSGTMLADNTSTHVWSGTFVYVDAGCTAQLDGNFSTTTGSATYGFTVNGTLICPAAYFMNGAGIFTVNSAATLEVAIATGINGAITTTGTKTFNTGANYTFNGSAAQVTGSYLPVSLVAPDTITINNTAGVTLSQTTATTGTLLFASGLLNTTTAYTISVPGAATNVAGAGATSYVNGTLIKTITGLTTVNYEVGDLDYAPVLLTLSTAGTAGSIGLKATNGLHPSVGTSGLSIANIANHYWTVTNLSAAGPATVIPEATYNFTDIIGGSNTAFVTQEYNGTAWLGAALPTTNTSSPYTSAPNTGIALGTLAGDYVFGNDFCGTLPITGTTTVCTGSAITLLDATTGGTWTSGTPGVAIISGSGVVTPVAAGTTIITYSSGGCAVTAVVTVNTVPTAGTITGSVNVCVTYTDNLADTAPGGVWSSSAPALGSISTAGIVTGIAAGSTIISYTVTNSCGTATATLDVTVHSTASCALLAGNAIQPPSTPELTVFPNPNSGTFTLDLLAQADEPVRITITNIVGEKITELITTTNKDNEITLIAPPGIYLLSAATSEGRYNAKVLVK